jgi:hypothetical protein
VTRNKFAKEGGLYVGQQLPVDTGIFLRVFWYKITLRIDPASADDGDKSRVRSRKVKKNWSIQTFKKLLVVERERPNENTNTPELPTIQ